MSINIRFFDTQADNAPQRAQVISSQPSAFSNPQASTNMTMIAQLEIGDRRLENGELKVYVGGELRFEMNGEPLTIVNRSIVNYVPDSHHGSMKSPIILRKDTDRPYKIIENDHVVIIRNNEKYDVTGVKL